MSKRVLTPSEQVMALQEDAVGRGVLSLWTIYERPLDCPEGFIARRFEVGGGRPEPVPTADTLASEELEVIRKVLRLAGLVCLTRSDEDHPTVVETWL